MLTSPFPTLTRTKKEEQFWDSGAEEHRTFPSIDEDHTVHLTVVVPAYEEEERCKLKIVLVGRTIQNLSRKYY